MTSGPVPPAAPMGGFVPPEPQTTSGSAITSMILGILGCIPLLTSLLAVILAIVGFKATSNNKMKGRGFAIAGLVLGLLGIVGWGFFGVAMLIALSASEQPRLITRDFARQTAAGNYAAAMALCDSSVQQADLENLNRAMTTSGTYTDLTSFSINVRTGGGVTVCELKGAAYFSSTARNFEANLTKDGAGAWKITYFEIK